MKQDPVFSYCAPEEYARQAVLEEVADRLLAAADRVLSTPLYPYHTERTLTRRMVRDVHYPVLPVQREVPPPPRLQVALRQLTRLPLGSRPRLAFRLLARGRTAGEVARRLGVSDDQIGRWKAEVCAALREELPAGSDQLLRRDQQAREAFREDSGRYAIWEDSHCEPGQEACRGTGQCICRWYLHYASE
jgi:hypothetical protein